jgi:CheY-like chemotaxis protein/predicted transcriptional regulator
MIHEGILGSFSLDVTKRILDTLNRRGCSMKKTNLASKAGLNYNVCLRYIRILNGLGWVEVNSEVSITETGKGVYAKLVDAFKARASITADSILPSNLEKRNIEYIWPSYIVSTTETKLSSTATCEKQPALMSKQKKGRNKKTIMIIEDEEDVAKTYEYFLSSVGYEVKTFIDSYSALHEYLSNPFLYDLLILDIRMQGINGLQLYQIIKTINSESKAIFLSALDAAKEIVSILPGTKPQDIIRKPVSKKQFITAVKTALI